MATIQFFLRDLCKLCYEICSFGGERTDRSIQNLVHFDHSVLKAFSPFFAGNYMVRNKTEGWKSLGGILLAFTGVEALFADLGAFSRGYVAMKPSDLPNSS